MRNTILREVPKALTTGNILEIIYSSSGNDRDIVKTLQI